MTCRIELVQSLVWHVQTRESPELALQLQEILKIPGNGAAAGTCGAAGPGAPAGRWCAAVSNSELHLSVSADIITF